MQDNPFNPSSEEERRMATRLTADIDNFLSSAVDDDFIFDEPSTLNRGETSDMPYAGVSRSPSMDRRKYWSVLPIAALFIFASLILCRLFWWKVTSNEISVAEISPISSGEKPVESEVNEGLTSDPDMEDMQLADLPSKNDGVSTLWTSIRSREGRWTPVRECLEGVERLDIASRKFVEVDVNGILDLPCNFAAEAVSLGSGNASALSESDGGDESLKDTLKSALESMDSRGLVAASLSVSPLILAWDLWEEK